MAFLIPLCCNAFRTADNPLRKITQFSVRPAAIVPICCGRACTGHQDKEERRLEPVDGLHDVDEFSSYRCMGNPFPSVSFTDPGVNAWLRRDPSFSRQLSTARPESPHA